MFGVLKIKRHACSYAWMRENIFSTENFCKIKFFCFAWNFFFVCVFLYEVKWALYVRILHWKLFLSVTFSKKKYNFMFCNFFKVFIRTLNFFFKHQMNKFNITFTLNLIPKKRLPLNFPHNLFNSKSSSHLFAELQKH